MEMGRQGGSHPSPQHSGSCGVRIEVPCQPELENETWSRQRKEDGKPANNHKLYKFKKKKKKKKKLAEAKSLDGYCLEQWFTAFLMVR